MTWILMYPKTWGFFFWLLSLAAGAAALVLADFGAPAWLFIAIGAWLLTAGLPTLVATLAVASAWGDFPFPSNALVFWNRLEPRTLLRLISERNLFERNYRLQRALGLPPAAFDRGAKLLAAMEAR